MGERTPLAALDAPASGRMAVGEAITNLLAAPIELSRVKLSANWMAACGEPGEDAALYETVKAVGLELCPALGISIPVGKDSLSMRTQWKDGAENKKVTSPVSLIVTAFATLADVRGTLTPQLDASEADTTLVLVDLGRGRQRMAGSILAQTLAQSGDTVPDLDHPQDLVKLVEAVNALRADGKILALHDRSDGGLFAAACEMAFAGHVGIALNVDMLITEGDGISDSRADTAMPRIGPGQVSARREELTLKALFNEELGVLMQVRTAERNEVMQLLRAHGLSAHSHFVGKTRPDSSAIDAGKGKVEVWRDAKSVFSANLADLHQVWDSVSWKICRERDNPDCADAEHAAAGDSQDPGAHVVLPPAATDNVAAPFLNQARPRVAILREQGVNSHVEMAYAFTESGFEAFDVHMTDLQTGRADLADFKGIVACGGFSYGDTLGAGIGWARSITFNPKLAEQFKGFFGRADTFGLGVCNGCQMFARTGRHHSGGRGLAALHDQPERAFRGAPVDGRGARFAEPLLRGHGRQPHAHRRRTRGGLRQLQAPRRSGAGDRGDALRRQPRRPDRTLSVQSERQRRRPDIGHHRGRPLHRADAASRAGLPQHPEELDDRRSQRAQSVDADLAQCAQVGGLSVLSPVATKKAARGPLFFLSAWSWPIRPWPWPATLPDRPAAAAAAVAG